MNDDIILKANDVRWVYHYKFIDFYLYYQAQFSKRIRLTSGLGPGAAFGKNQIITKIWLNPEPPVDAVIWTKDVNASYFGLSQKSELTYSFLNGRLDAGLLLSGKYYFGLGPQIDLGFVAGFNF